MIRLLMAVLFVTVFLFTGTEAIATDDKPASPPIPELVTYHFVIAHMDVNDDPKTTVAVKARECKPLYYDKRLIRVNCFKDGEHVWKNGGWMFKGENIVFDGVVKAYYQVGAD